MTAKRIGGVGDDDIVRDLARRWQLDAHQVLDLVRRRVSEAGS